MSASAPVNYPLIAFHYNPSQAGATAAGITFAVVSALLFVRVFRGRTWWGLVLPIGTLLFSLGFFVRLALAIHPTAFGLLVLSQILIVASPGAFLAFNYVVYGRFVRTFAAGRSQFSLIKPQIVARVFILSDVVTFIIQAAGASLFSKVETVDTGRTILLIGIAVQTASYVLFWGLLLHSHWKFSKDEKYDKSNFPWRLVQVLHFSSFLIMVRAIYRLIELTQGKGGHLITHEVYFYCLDTVPLFLATTIYVIFWPGKLIEVDHKEDYLSVDMAPLERQPA